LIDGDFKLTETNAIQHYLVKRAGKNELLGGDDVARKGKIAMIQSLVDELNMTMIKLVYNPEFDTIRGTYFDE